MQAAPFPLAAAFTFTLKCPVVGLLAAHTPEQQKTIYIYILDKGSPLSARCVFQLHPQLPKHRREVKTIAALVGHENNRNFKSGHLTGVPRP